jgi:hypothetical protein
MGGSGGAIQQLLQCNAVCMYYCGPGSEKKYKCIGGFYVIISLSFLFPCSARLVSGKKK